MSWLMLVIVGLVISHLVNRIYNKSNPCESSVDEYMSALESLGLFSICIGM